LSPPYQLGPVAAFTSAATLEEHQDAPPRGVRQLGPSVDHRRTAAKFTFTVSTAD